MATTESNSPPAAPTSPSLSMPETLSLLIKNELMPHEYGVASPSSASLEPAATESAPSPKSDRVRLELEIKGAKNLNDVCLRFLVQMGEQGALEKLLAQGMDASLFDRLRKMSMEDLNQLHSQQALFSLVLNVDIAKQMIAGHDARTEDQKFLAYFVERGATTEFLRRVLRVSDDKIQSFRRVYSTKRGRPPRPPELDVDAIIAQWRSIRMIETRPRDRYYQLAEAFTQYSFSTLSNVIDEMESEEDQRRRRIA